MTPEQLHEKVLSLPYEPGVYLMMDKTGNIIYVGKAKKLKNRVSQYFQASAAHTPKTLRMVSQIADFDVIVAASEFEALVLECSLIKRHMPKYNILLKDDKGYPYIRVDLREEYPKFVMTNRVAEDGADYFGPYGGRSVTQHAIDTIRLTLKLPGCSKQFPRDVGKDRPCLNYHIGACAGWCQGGEQSMQRYHAAMEQAVLILRGKYDEVAEQIRQEMEIAAEALHFERAAELRDRLHAIERLSQKQLVVAGSMADTDVIGFYEDEAKACFTVLHFLKGNLVDKDFRIVDNGALPSDAVSSLVKQYYLDRGAAPKEVVLPVPMDDAEPFAQMLLQTLGKKVRIRVPQRGDSVRLVELANKNAKEEAERVTTRAERISGTLTLLGKLLCLSEPPRRIEAYDISNTAGTDIVASMTVFCDGQPSKKDYKRFAIEGLSGQDDYGSMRQVLRRRFTHFLAGDAGFAEKPDLLLIDGGAKHAAAVCGELAALGVSIPTFGMVKDGRHRTRALITAEGTEIGISTVPAIFAMVGRIQEETHRFAIEYHKTLRSKRLHQSELDQIPGVGQKRRLALLQAFPSIRAIREASLAQLEGVVPKNTAASVYSYFHPGEEKKPCESSPVPPAEQSS